MNRGEFIVLALAPILLFSPTVHAGDTDRSCTELYALSKFESAMAACRKEAKRGESEAQLRLGLLYANGQGVKQSYSEAAKWYKKAAAQGLAIAQSNLGALYANGQGVKQSYSEAMKWYQKAAEQGLAIAQYNLGLEYAKGQGVEQDADQAVKWLSEAANQGDANSQFVLGLIYGGSIEGMRNDTASAEWFYMAGMSYLKMNDKESAFRCFEQMKTLVVVPRTSRLADELHTAISGGSE